MVQLRALVTAAFSVIATAAASNVKALDPSTFDSTVFGGIPSLVEFYAPWCGHCKKLAPTYEELADSLVGKKVNIAKVDADEHKSLGTDHGVTGFPTIKWFDGTSKEGEAYNGARDLDALQAFIQEKSGAKAKRAAKAPSVVEMLTDQTFDKSVGKDKDYIVAFTAPWCGHCKTLAPIWDTLAEDYLPDNALVGIGKVDAEANPKIAEKYEIKSYPTIKFFPKGASEPVDYSGGRDESSFITYINDKVGTHRAVGGGLDLAAGTIATLDTIVEKLTGGADTATVSEELKTASQSLKDKYAEYYIKVLDKLALNAGYVKKETGRLEGILQKGGLARSKSDDLTSRLNILKKFGLSDRLEKSEL